jgi:hypothetical protein
MLQLKIAISANFLRNYQSALATSPPEANPKIIPGINAIWTAA